MTRHQTFKKMFTGRNLLYVSIIVVVIGLLVGLSIGIPLSIKKDSLKNAKQILSKYVLIDGHNDLPHMIRKNFKNQFGQFNFTDMKASVLNDAITHTDLIRIKEGKLGGQFWVTYASCDTLAKDATRLHMEQIDVIKRLIRKHSGDMEFVTDSAGILKAFKNKKIASMIGLESGHAIDSSTAILRIFYELGKNFGLFRFCIKYFLINILIFFN